LSLLSLDRRTFLQSYVPGSRRGDTRTHLTAGPVAGGISLEYYFSRVDNVRYGYGTKVPHNVTGMIGVMDGAQSDLRTGLPYQMVWVHEPMQLIFVVEALPGAGQCYRPAPPTPWKSCSITSGHLVILDYRSGRSTVTSQEDRSNTSRSGRPYPEGTGKGSRRATKAEKESETQVHVSATI
ncbi:MAG: putative inorganic carbon transporter subunit DabA, partial [Nitrospiraceae bacterium]